MLDREGEGGYCSDNCCCENCKKIALPMLAIVRNDDTNWWLHVTHHSTFFVAFLMTCPILCIVLDDVSNTRPISTRVNQGVVLTKPPTFRRCVRTNGGLIRKSEKTGRVLHPPNGLASHWHSSEHARWSHHRRGFGPILGQNVTSVTNHPHLDVAPERAGA